MNLPPHIGTTASTNDIPYITFPAAHSRYTAAAYEVERSRSLSPQNKLKRDFATQEMTRKNGHVQTA